MVVPSDQRHPKPMGWLVVGAALTPAPSPCASPPANAPGVWRREQHASTPTPGQDNIARASTDTNPDTACTAIDDPNSATARSPIAAHVLPCSVRAQRRADRNVVGDHR